MWNSYKEKWNQIKKQHPNAFRNVNFDATLQRTIHSETGELLILHNPSHFTSKRPASTMSNEKVTWQPWTEARFNYTRVASEEVIARPTNDHAILINASPIVDYHGLFVPFCHRGFPQALVDQPGITSLQESLNAVAQIWISLETQVKLMYNSLGAWSSVNHQHWHFVSTESTLLDTRVPIESSKRTLLHENDELQLFFLDGWPSGGFVVSSSSATQVMHAIGRFAPLLVDANVPHTIILSKFDTYSAYIIPRAYQYEQVLENGMGFPFSVAVAELSGIIMVPSRESYDNLTYKDYCETVNQVNLFGNNVYSNWAPMLPTQPLLVESICVSKLGHDLISLAISSIYRGATSKGTMNLSPNGDLHLDSMPGNKAPMATLDTPQYNK
jgi:hypothetical protein